MTSVEQKKEKHKKKAIHQGEKRDYDWKKKKEGLCE